jgi:dipeptidyl-peptidase-4
MRLYAALFGAVAVAVVVQDRPVSGGAQPAGRRVLSYEQAFGGEAGRGGGAAVTAPLPDVTGWADAEHYLERRVDPADRQRKLFSVAVADGRAAVHRDDAEMRTHLPDGFDPAAAAATTADLMGFVFARDNDLFHYDAASKRFRRLTANAGEERNPRLSPDGTWIAYTRDRNLYAYDLDAGVEHQYTTDGSDTISNGWASWVYMEEILGRASRYAAFWWSPDSDRLAFMRFDDGPVPVFPIYHADGQHGELERQRYPKAGDPNPYVQMGVVRVNDGGVVWMDFDPKADHYIAWPFWTPDSRMLTVQWMNRGQDTIRFYNCDPDTGKKTQIFEERQPSWVEFFEDLYYFKNGSGFLLRSNADGWDHLYYYASDGSLKARLTSGDWRVNSIALVDEERGYVYFVARQPRPWDTQLMRVRLDGTGMEALTKAEGAHQPQVSPDGAHFIDTFSTIASPAVMNLHRSDGTIVRTLGSARTAATGEYAWGRAELFTIPSEDGRFQLPAYWILPPDFDPSRQYPVIFSIYGGPDAGRVRNSWPGLAPHYWAQRGVITISVDHRAGGAFGKQGVALMHRSLGKWEMIDLIAAAKWLRTRPFVAKDRIGITGSSYGGYTTLLALTAGAGHFNFGQSGSPVTAWELYDTVYTERYMDTPEENPDGYKAGAVLTYIDRYTGGLRITHGTIDDNVHAQNSVQVIDWLTTNNKRFEMTLYPDSRHGISQRAHLSREAHDYWVRTLLGGRLPDAMTSAAR